MPTIGTSIGVGRRLSTGGGSAPVSDPIILSDNANGWSVTTTSNPPSMDPAGAPRFLYGFEPGYDSAFQPIMVPVTRVLTQRIRQTYPNNGSLTADQVALSDVLYQDGTYLGITHNSTERSPKPVAKWALPPNRVVGNTLHMQLTVFHRNAGDNKQVACVQFRATDGVNTVTQKVFGSTILSYPGDQFAIVGYQVALDITSLTAGQITGNARIAPRMGISASVIDSADQSDGREFSPQVFLKNVTLAANPVYVYVAASGGNDTTGAVSSTAATAEAAPCATYAGAVNRAVAVNGSVDGVVIRFMAGTHVLASAAIIATRPQTAGWLTVTRDPNASRAAVILQHGTAALRSRLGTSGGFLKISSVSLERVGTQGLISGEATSLATLWLDDIAYNTGASNSNVYGSNSLGGYWTGVEFSNLLADTTSLLGASTPGSHRLIRGCSGDMNGANIELCNIIGCHFIRPKNISSGTVRSASGAVLAFNRLTSPTSTTCITAGVPSGSSFVGLAIVQNVIEATQGGSHHVIGISNDSGFGDNTHVILHNNTMAGAYEAGRCNLFYDEGVTPRTSKLMSVVGNIFVAIFTKSDHFRGANQAGADASTRTGNWQFLWGAGCRANFSMHQSNTPLGGNESQAYGGLRSKIGTSQITRQDPLFTDFKATTVAAGPTYTAGAGGGTYTLQAGSPCIGINDDGVLAFDLAGTARSANASAAGAYERLAA